MVHLSGDGCAPRLLRHGRCPVDSDCGHLVRLLIEPLDCYDMQHRVAMKDVRWIQIVDGTSLD